MLSLLFPLGRWDLCSRLLTIIGIDHHWSNYGHDVEAPYGLRKHEGAKTQEELWGGIDLCSNSRTFSGSICRSAATSWGISEVFGPWTSRFCASSKQHLHAPPPPLASSSWEPVQVWQGLTGRGDINDRERRWESVCFLSRWASQLSGTNPVCIHCQSVCLSVCLLVCFGLVCRVKVSLQQPNGDLTQQAS